MGRSIHAPLRKGWRRSQCMWELDLRCATSGGAEPCPLRVVLARPGGARPAVVAVLVAVAASKLRWPRAAPGAAAGKSNGRRGKRAQRDKPQHAATFQYAWFHHAPAEMRALRLCM